MATKTYRNISQDATGYATLVADIKALTTWSDVAEGETSTQFKNSNGGHMVVVFTGTQIMVSVYRDGGATMFQIYGVVTVCFIKTTKAIAIVFNQATAAVDDDDWMNKNYSRQWVIIGSAENMLTGEICQDQMTTVRACRVAQVDNADPSSTSTGEWNAANMEQYAKFNVAVGLHSAKSPYMSTVALMHIASTVDVPVEGAVEMGGKKYYTADYVLLADDD